MTSDPRLPDYLRHMEEAAQPSLEYTADMDYAAFLADEITQKAVLFNFVILGEAVTKLMVKHADFLAQHPQVAWRSIRDMCNQVAHGYFTINTEVVWRTVQSALPDLLAELRAITAAAGQATGQAPTATS